MRIRLAPFAVVVALSWLGGEARAQVVPPPYRPLARVLPPAGRPIPTPPLASLPYPVPGYQPSRYQVWQNYGWTYNGWMRPRIWQTNNGGYWLYNGAPYPYVYTQPGRHFSSFAPAGAPGP